MSANPLFHVRKHVILCRLYLDGKYHCNVMWLDTSVGTNFLFSQDMHYPELLFSLFWMDFPLQDWWQTMIDGHTYIFCDCSRTIIQSQNPLAYMHGHAYIIIILIGSYNSLEQNLVLDNPLYVFSYISWHIIVRR